MLTFVHLSDIHFSARDDYSQRDLDQHVRRALIKDLSAIPIKEGRFDGLLLTGDIAFSGLRSEYQTAKMWLDDVFKETGLVMERTYTVPGNHDIDRSFSELNLPLRSIHKDIRKSDDENYWNKVCDTLIYKDPSKLLLAPLNAYNDFAQGCGCTTTPDQLAWCRVFELPMEDGTHLRFHGLNSAIISNEEDAQGKLLVTRIQTSHFQDSPELVNVVLCHHPPEWLMHADKVHLRDLLRSFAPVALFGHEHSVRYQPEETQVQLFAGAVQPSRRDPGWLPTYHILQLGIESSPDSRNLVVRIHTREFDSKNYRFRAFRDAKDREIFEHRIKLPPWRSPDVPSATETVTPVSVLQNMADPEFPANEPDATDTARRTLLVHFFQLGTPLRYAAALEAGLLREGDDALHPQVMWAEVFRRAIDENLLATFWETVAVRCPEIKDTPNPFTPHDNAQTHN